MGIVRINQGKALPLKYRLLLVTILWLMVLFALKHLTSLLAIFISIVLCYLVSTVWFAAKIFIVDSEDCHLFVGFWIMGFKKGKWIFFKSLEIDVEKKQTKKGILKTSHNHHVISNTKYTAYVKIDNSERFYLFAHPDQERVLEKITMINKKLGLSSK
ncbi:MAG: hypothetical protein AAF600_02335 [Bacteroidota bacterium]